MILRLMFALALTLAGLGLAPVNVTLAANSGWGIQLGLDGPGEGGAKRRERHGRAMPCKGHEHQRLGRQFRLLQLRQCRRSFIGTAVRETERPRRGEIAPLVLVGT